MFPFSFFFCAFFVVCVYSRPLYCTQQDGTTLNSCTVNAYSKDQEFEPRPRLRLPYLGILGLSKVHPDNHRASQGLNKQLMPVCYTAGNDRCTCGDKTHGTADAGLMPAALGSTRTYDADDCIFTTRNKFPSHLSSQSKWCLGFLPCKRRSETSFGLIVGHCD